MEPKINLSFDRFTNNLKKPIRCMQYKEAYVMDYDTAIELSETQEDVFWTAKEIAVEKDVHDIMVNMTEAERHGVITVLKLFTKYEIEAGDSWWGRKVQDMFPRPCIMRMANCFSFIETNVHAPFYNKLNEALHINTEEFYMSYKDDKTLDDRMQFIRNIMKTDDPMIATALFAMIEGVVLYSSFAFLKHFQSKGKNKLLNVVRGINFSVRDEACLQKGTEVLTDSGWKKIETVSLDDKVCQYNTNDKTYSYTKPSKLHHTIDTISYEINGDNIHQVVTGDHRIITDSGEILAQEMTGQENILLSASENDGDDVFGDEDMICIDMIISGSLPIIWLYDKLPYVSKKWAREATEYYLLSKKIKN